MESAAEHKPFFRSPNAYIGGVCAGIAEYYDIDALVARLLAILLFLASFGLAGIVYLVLWHHFPIKPEAETPVDVQPEDASLVVHEEAELDSADGKFHRVEWVGKPVMRVSIRTRLAIVVLLVLLFLLVSFGLAPFAVEVSWWQFWPLLLLINGIFFMVIPVRSRNNGAWQAGGIVATSIAISVLPMSLNIVSWDTVLYSFELLWPIFAVSLLLFVVGLSKHSSAVQMTAALLFAIFCFAGSTLCVLPGELEALALAFSEDFEFMVPLSWLPVVTGVQ